MLECRIINGQMTTAETDSPFDAETDILVVGLGTAGAVAAIVAAESGLRTTGVERTTGMGGAGTLGCVWDYYYGSPGGRYEAVNRTCFELREQGYVRSDMNIKDNSLPGAVKCQVLEQSARRAGCAIRYETIVIGLFMEKNKVIGARLLQHGQSLCIRCAILIDCTGEAAICRMAGCSLKHGRAWDGQRPMLSKTMGHLQNDFVRGAWLMADPVDVFDAGALSDKILSLTAGPFYLQDQYHEQGRMVYEGAILGVRETYNVEAEMNLTFAGLMAGLRTAEPLFYAFSPLDLVRRDIVLESEALQNWHLIAELFEFGFSVGIPAGTLIPKGCEGLLVAGKGIGIDHDLAASARMKKDMEKCGEAAAVLAALAVRLNVPAREVSYQELSRQLQLSGCLNAEDDVVLGNLQVKDGQRWQRVPMLEQLDAVRSGLDSDDPRVAFWSIWQGGCHWLPDLIQWCQDPSPRLARNSAIAAGLLGDTRVCPELRAIVTQQPNETDRHVRRFPAACKAICLLGRLADADAAGILLQIVADNALAISEPYELGLSYRTRDDFVFQFLSFAIRSLLSIAAAHPGLRSEIARQLTSWATTPGFSLVISLGPTDLGPMLQQMILKDLAR